ncbi:HlyD family secretion protein [Roseomonas eburnea]|uniref:HlyD family secretion protein n=1 Tax=Neoroseomonas eburnea TaxID=1346889 RepID=A0A9X9XGR7_9PROT|nr:HlyD family secretion protein [Neoroseomonas eburnea]
MVGVLGPDARLWLYLDRYPSAEPVDNAEISATLDGQPVPVTRSAEATYVIAHPLLGQPGARSLILTITAGADMDLLPLDIEVPAAAAASVVTQGWRETATRAAAEPVAWAAGLALLLLGVVIGRAAAPRNLPPMVAPDGIALKPMTEAVSEPHHKPAAGRVPARAAAAPMALILGLLALPATAQPMDQPRRQPDGSVFVPKPTQRLLGVRAAMVDRADAPVALQLVGQVIADPNASGRVQAPQAGRVEAPPAGFPTLGSRVERGQTMAYIVPVLGAQERSGVQATLAELDSQIGIAQQRTQRLAGLAGSVSAREIAEARAELDGLRARRAAVAEGLNGRLAVQATASGFISVVAAVGGQIVDAREPLFEIVEPTRLWVEAVAYDGGMVADIAGARATTAGGLGLDLAFIGRGLALRQQAVPLQFRIVNAPPGLSVGTPVTVTVQTNRRAAGIVLPGEAVIRSAEGPPIVFEMASAERFVPRPVRVQPLDGRNVLVLAGLEPGNRVVTEAASLIAQIR